MGCVSSKGLKRGPGKASWYSPLSRNASVAANQSFSEDKDVHHISLASSSYGELNAETCQGSCFNIRRKGSCTFASNLDVNSRLTHLGTAPIMQCEDSKHSIHMCNNLDKKSVAIQKSTEFDDERQHFLMCDYLHLQHAVASKGRKGNLWEDETKKLFLWDDRDVKNGRNDGSIDFLLPESGCKSAVQFESVDVIHMGASTRTNITDFLDSNDGRKSFVDGSDTEQHDTEIIDMQDLMEGLEDDSKTLFSSRSGVHGTLSIPDRDISFNAFPGLNVSGSDVDSPVWKKYYIADNGVNTWNGLSPALGSPFMESPRRAPSQSSFIEADDVKSVSSIEIPDASAIGLKLLLSPASSSFHPSPINKAHSVVSSVDGFAHSSCTTNANCYDVSSPFRSRKPSMESMYGLTEQDYMGIDMRNLYKSPPSITLSNSRRPSVESVYESGSPLFDPSLMATFEEALKVSTAGGSAYDNWLSFSIAESATFTLSSTNTWEFSDISAHAEKAPSELTIAKWPATPSYEHEVKSRADLASYELRCPPRGEGKVVFYFTSLRGVRKTYQDCCNVRLILRGLGVQVDERDVWMHSKFKSELNDILDGLSKGMPLVPQLFIKGRYIGGADVIRQLHEEGILSCLMDGLAMGLILGECNGCGDVRFIPCLTCNGSRKVLRNAVSEVAQCLACNENGLIMCPICIQP